MDKRFIIVLIAIFIGFIAISVFTKKDDAATGTTAQSEKGSQNFYGKEDSKVTLTEFVDFQCEACYAYYPYVKQVKELYKDRVRFQVRNFPISSGHQFAMQAARNAEAAAMQGKFWEMHNRIFEGQKMWEQSKDPQVYFDDYAKEIGLDMNRFKEDFAGKNANAVINKDLADARTLGVDGTPTFILNGKKIDNPGPSVEALSKLLDDALAQNSQ